MKRTLLAIAIALPIFAGCSSSDDEPTEDIKVTQLPKMENVSLNYHVSTHTITLARDVQKEGASVSLRYNSYWISRLELNGNKISFQVNENPDIELGHRFDTILVSYKGERIGSICVSQARKPISAEKLRWALSDAIYRSEAISTSSMSGKEITKAIYNLEKTTNGKDSYKNYPAFAYCIEMNHDPDNNMEWHLPTKEEVIKYAKAQSYKDTPFEQHTYWWTASENEDKAYSIYSQSIASRGAESKGKEWWVMAFRNGAMEE